MLPTAPRGPQHLPIFGPPDRRGLWECRPCAAVPWVLATAGLAAGPWLAIVSPAKRRCLYKYWESSEAAGSTGGRAVAHAVRGVLPLTGPHSPPRADRCPDTEGGLQALAVRLAGCRSFLGPSQSLL